MNEKRLISHGYFPIEMPPCFTSELFANALTFIENDWNKLSNKEQNKYKETICVNYSVPKIGITRRKLGIPNPLSHWKLSKCIAENWTELEKYLQSDISASLPIYSPKGLRSVKTKLTYGEFRRAGVLDSYGKIYELKIDVSRYYASIYTHCIPWVLHTKSVAKVKRKDKSLLGNRLDELIRDCQSSQTVGIPIGPDTSLIISELVGCWIDAEFSQKISGYAGYRYVDDFNLFFNTLENAENAARLLQEIFVSINLDVNEAKTIIKRSPHFFDNGWSYVLANHEFDSRSDVKQKNTLINFFDLAFRYSIEYPNDNVLKYAVKILSNINVSKTNWHIYESMLMKTVITEPSTLQEFARIAYNNRTIIDKNKLLEVIHLLLSEHVYKANSYEVGWALWLLSLFQLKLKNDIAEKLFSVDDSCILLQALSLKKAGLIDNSVNQSIIKGIFIDSSLLDEHWLLVYEAIQQNLVDSKFNSIVDSNQFFKILKNHKIFFFNNKRLDFTFYYKKKKVMQGPIGVSPKYTEPFFTNEYYDK